MNVMDIKKDAEGLYDDIDACIGSLVSGMMRKDEERVDAALQKTGTLLLRTMQFLRCLLDTLSETSDNSV